MASTLPQEIVVVFIWRLKHYLRIIVCQPGVYLEKYGSPKVIIKMDLGLKIANSSEKSLPFVLR